MFYYHGDLEEIKTKEIEKVLVGKYHRLAAAFIWHKTPQGDKFWSKLCHNNMILWEDMKTAKKYLRYLIELKEGKEMTQNKTIEDLQKEVEIAQSSLERMQKQLDEMKAAKTVGRWNPVKGDKMFVVGSEGDVFDGTCVNSGLDERWFEMGMVFKTKEEAETFVTRHKAKVRALDILEKHAAGFMPDWKNVNQRKFYPCFIHGGVIDQNSSSWVKHWPFTHLPTKETCQAAIDEAGDDLLILMGVK